MDSSGGMSQLWPQLERDLDRLLNINPFNAAATTASAAAAGGPGLSPALIAVSQHLAAMTATWAASAYVLAKSCMAYFKAPPGSPGSHVSTTAPLFAKAAAQVLAVAALAQQQDASIVTDRDNFLRAAARWCLLIDACCEACLPPHGGSAGVLAEAFESEGELALCGRVHHAPGGLPYIGIGLSDCHCKRMHGVYNTQPDDYLSYKEGLLSPFHTRGCCPLTWWLLLRGTAQPGCGTGCCRC